MHLGFQMICHVVRSARHGNDFRTMESWKPRQYQSCDLSMGSRMEAPVLKMTDYLSLLILGFVDIYVFQP